MNEIDFNLASIQYFDIEELKNRELTAPPPDNQIVVTVALTHYTGTNIPSRVWSDKSIWFQTTNENQELRINLVSPQITAEKPRFYLSHLELIDAEANKFIKEITHMHPGGAKTMAAQQHFSEHTYSIVMHLAFPGKKPRTSFEFKLWAKDREKNDRLINCDPLVGNDPPDDGKGP